MLKKNKRFLFIIYFKNNQKYNKKKLSKLLKYNLFVK